MSSERQWKYDQKLITRIRAKKILDEQITSKEEKEIKKRRERKKKVRKH